MDSVFAVGFSIYFGAELSFKTSIKNNGTFSQIILKQKLLNYLHDSVVKKKKGLPGIQGCMRGWGGLESKSEGPVLTSMAEERVREGTKRNEKWRSAEVRTCVLRENDHFLLTPV